MNNSHIAATIRRRQRRLLAQIKTLNTRIDVTVASCIKPLSDVDASTIRDLRATLVAFEARYAELSNDLDYLRK